MVSGVVGIDFGSNASRMAYLEAAKKMPTIVRNDLSNESTATCIAAVPGDARTFGDNAASKCVSKPACAVDDLVSWTLHGSHELRTIGDEEDLPSCRATSYFFKSLLSFVASDKLKDAKVAVAVPPGVTADGLSTLKTSVALAGVDEQRIVLVDSSEAALVYLHHLQRASLPSGENAVPQGVIIVDVGKAHTTIVAGTVTMERIVKVSSVTIPMGSGFLDAQLAEQVIAAVEQKHKGLGLKQHAKSYAKILRECKKAKEMMSSVDTARVQAESLKDDIDVNHPVSRKEMDIAAKPFLDMLSQSLHNLKETHSTTLAPEGAPEVRVEAIGSGWRSVFVMDCIKNTLGVSRVGVSLDANMAVAEGAAIFTVCTDSSIRAGAAPDAAEQQDAATGRDDIHTVSLEQFDSIGRQVDMRCADEVAVMRTAEEASEAKDEAIHRRIRAINALDSFVLQTMEASNGCTTESKKQDEIRQFLAPDEEYVRDDCNGDSVEAIEKRLADVQAQIAEKFPEIAAHYQALKEEQKKKDEELERLSKLQSEDKELKSDPQRLRGAQQRREQGQNLFKQEHWAEAQTRFVQALAILGEIYDTKDPENKKKKDEISLSCHLNIASCSIKLNMWRNAFNNATSALELSPNHAKALFRRGQASAAMNDFAAARKDLELAKSLSNGDAAVAAELDAVIKKDEAAKAKEKKMFAKMFS